MGRKPALAVCATLIAGALGCTLTLVRAPQFVTFVQPANAAQAQALPPLDPAALANALGGTPQKVKVIIPCQAHQRVIRVKAQRKRRVLPQLQAVRLASLRTPPPPPKTYPAHEVMVTTQWTETRTAEGMVYAVSRQQIRRTLAKGTEQIHSPPTAQVVSGVYVVRTPDGWLIIQI